MAKDTDNSCWICGKKELLPFTCRYCGKNFCMSHRLPEQHACQGLEFAKRHSGYTSGASGKNHDDIFKDMLRTTTKKVAKGVARNIWGSIMSSMKNSPSMAIIYICLVSFLLGNGYFNLIPGYFDFFKLTPALILMRPWTIITHMFLHVDLGHLFFNMLVLFFFGRELENRVGNSTFLKVYFISGIVAAVGYCLTVSDTSAAVVGASGAIMGVFAALTVLAPELRVYVYFIPMQIKYALLLFAVLDFVLMGSNDMVAHTAHLSGTLVGLFMGFQLKKNMKKYNNAYNNYYRRW